MSDEHVQRLVVTPMPVRTESAWGYLLRLTEANGYETPGLLFRHARLPDAISRHALIPLAEFAPLTGRKPGDFGKLAYSAAGQNCRNGLIRVLDHWLPVHDVSLKRQRICPQCVVETGSIDAYWDMRVAIACPHHRVLATTSCPTCSRRLSWFRPGLLTCRCGCVITPSSQASDAMPGLNGLLLTIWLKLRNAELPALELQADRFPLEALQSMSLRTLLALIDRFGRLFAEAAKGYVAETDCQVTRAVSAAAYAFADWPRGLHDLLEAHGRAQEKSSKRNGGSRQTLRDVFSKFHQAVFKSGFPPSEVAFLRREFARFVQQRWKRHLVDPRLHHGGDVPRQVVGVTELAQRLRVRPGTVHHMVELGIVRPVERDNESERWLFDVSKELPKRTTTGRTLSGRQATKLLGIPSAVLHALRLNGTFVVRHFGVKLRAFHEADLATFCERLLAMPAVPVEAASEIVTFEQCMRMKLGGPQRKAEMIAGILSGTLQVIGEKATTIGSIQLHKREIIEQAHESSANESGSRLLSEVAQRLDCDRLAIPWLVKQGFLSAVETNNALRIVEDTLLKFEQEFVSCAWIAKQIPTSSRAVVARCTQHGVELLLARRSGRESVQPFIKRADMSRLGYSGLPLVASEECSRGQLLLAPTQNWSDGGAAIEN